MSATLEPLGPDIWVADGPVVDFYSFPYPTRMILVRLADGGLWAWSPIRLEQGLADEVAALGPVRHLVAPNQIHHLFLAEWQQHWPEAKLWGPRRLCEKRTDLEFDGVLGDAAPPDWAGQIEQFRFTNCRFLEEVDFVHLASRTAIFADLTENFSERFLARHWSWWQRPIARLWKIVEGWGYAPLEVRLTFRDRDEARSKLRSMLKCHPERVVMAHGEIARERGTDYLRQAFAWLLD